MPHEIYQIQFRVQPLPAHHQYWEIEAAHLALFLMEQSEGAALARATALLPLLFWEEIRTPDHPVLVTCVRGPQPHDETGRLLPALAIARQWGIALIVTAWQPGGTTDSEY